MTVYVKRVGLQRMEEQTDVLIIGGGPTGLMMACQLAMRNIAFRIIDKNEDHTTQSRALVIQARSLEILDQMGIAERAVGEGQIARQVYALFNGKRLLRLTVDEVGKNLTRFPYLLMLEQSKTESLLNAFLEERGHRVERLTELAELEQDETGVTATLIAAGGARRRIRAAYVVGADGAHSVTRHQLKIEFGGRTFQQSLFVMDCKADIDVPHDTMCLSFSDADIAGYFPLTNGRWRVLGTLPQTLEEKETVTFEAIEAGFAERMRTKVKLYDPQWVAIYRSHHRYAVTFQSGRCFLAGDAAHIHSPVGAQGMNTGLQDAYNLAWKLALVIGGKAGEKLLDTYTAERIVIARKLVRSTDRAFNLVTSRRFFMRVFRRYLLPAGMKLFLPLLVKIKLFRELAFKTISETGIHYRGGVLAQQASHGRFRRRAPRPGDRVPYVLFKDTSGKAISIHEKMRATRFSLLFFGEEKEADQLRDFAEQNKELFSLEIFPLTAGTTSLYETFGIKKGYLLVRPDLYIAFRSSVPETAPLEKNLAGFLRNVAR